MKTGILVSVLLYGYCLHDLITDLAGGPSGRRNRRKLINGDCRAFDTKVNAVEQGLRYSVQVAADFEGSAFAPSSVGEVATGAGIHGCEQQEIGGKAERAGLPCDDDFTIFQRLAKYFK